MKKMSTSQIRNSWIEFFKQRDHEFIEPSSLVPINDKSLLWINSGVATLKDYFSGKENPPSPRMTNSQKAIRTNDFFNVGLTSRHHTLFEMLGNFSIGDYFKEKSIELAYELLMNEWKIDPKLLWITVFHDDDTTFNKWVSLGINKDQIIRCGRDRNFWDVGSGPCGPCTEIHYDRGPKYDPKNIGPKLIIEDIENDRYIEIWNIVFSQFKNDGKNNYEELLRKNIDTGAGLERLASISQDVPTNFDIDIFQNIIKSIEKHSKYKYDLNNYFNKEENQAKTNYAYRVISDHLRAVVFAINDGVIPSNKDRGYILRRLLRRTMVFINKLKITNEDWIIDGVNAVVDSMSDFYSDLKTNKKKIIEIISKENNIFKKTLTKGLKLFNDSIKNNKLSNDVCFDLVVTYGFPIELIKEIAEEKNIEVDIEAFEKSFKKHQLISKNNKATEALDNQNDSLLNLTVKSTFDYDAEEMNSEIVKLFNNKFEEVKSLNNESGFVVFDKTCFYATSGGQINDTGTINNFVVDDVFKAPGLQHVHHVIDATLELNKKYKLEINKHNRKLIRHNHSAEHLLHASLKTNISESIKQEGAFKSPYKITFDFQHHVKINDNDLQKVEDWINNIIKKELEVKVLNLSLEEAKKAGALAYFGEMYKKLKGKLRVIKMGDGESMELCGGTHVHNTKDIESFQILEYYSKGSGSWRIEATSSIENIENYKKNILNKFEEEFTILKNIFEEEKYDLDYLNKKIKSFYEKLETSKLRNYSENFKTLQNEINDFKKESYFKNLENNTKKLKESLTSITSNKVALIVNNESMDSIKNSINELTNEKKETIFIVINLTNDSWKFIAMINQNYANEQKINLNVEIAKKLMSSFECKGGGRNHFVQGGGQSSITKEEITNFLTKEGFKIA